MSTGIWTAGRGAALLRVVKVVVLVTTCAVVTVAGLRGHAASPAWPAEDRSDGAGAGRSAVLQPVPGGALCPAAARTTALVRTPAGRTQVVSFSRGWAVYHGRAAGTLLRICPGRR